MVAAFWGVFIWREFREAPRGTQPLLLALMFVGYRRRAWSLVIVVAGACRRSRMP